MGKKKQRENERNYLEPVQDRLKPQWRDVFTFMMRGKQRGDGLMVDEERIDEIKDEVKRQITEAKREARKKVYEANDVNLKPSKSVYNSDDLSVEERSELSDLINEETRNIVRDDLDIWMKAMAVYLANEINTRDRGSYISANNILSRASGVIDSDKADRVAIVFGRLRKNPDFMPKPPGEVEEPRKLGKMYGDSLEKRQEAQRQKRSIFR